MFSNNFMRYLISYQSDDYQYSEKDYNSVKEINFKDKNKGTPIRVLVSIRNK